MIGTTYGAKTGVATLSPSIAESTEIAGVITPSPYRSAAPKRPSPSAASAVAPSVAPRSSCFPLPDIRET